MRFVVVLLVLSFFVLSASCSGDKKTRPEPGDPVVAGDPGGGQGDNATSGDPQGDSGGQGDAVAAAAVPSHTRVTSGSGEASSTNYKARVRVGGPMPPGTATGAGGEQLQGSTPTSP